MSIRCQEQPPGECREDSRASIQPVNWIRPAIILALLFASAGLAYLDPPGKLSLILLSLGPAMLGLLLYLRRPALGVLALVFAAMMVPLSVGTGTGTSLNPVILMVPLMTGIWLLTMALRHRAIRIHRHSSIYFLLALNITVILALIVGRLSWFDIPGAGTAAQLGGVMVFFVSSAAFLLAAHLLDERWLARLVYMFIFIGASIVVLQFVPSMRSSITRFVTIGAMGSVFWIWLVTLAAGLALFHTSLTIHTRLLLAAVAAVTLLFGFMRNGEWASGWAPPLVALLLLVWLKYPRWGWAFLFIATLVFSSSSTISGLWLPATKAGWLGGKPGRLSWIPLRRTRCWVWGHRIIIFMFSKLPSWAGAGRGA